MRSKDCKGLGNVSKDSFLQKPILSLPISADPGYIQQWVCATMGLYNNGYMQQWVCATMVMCNNGYAQQWLCATMGLSNNLAFTQWIVGFKVVWSTKNNFTVSDGICHGLENSEICVNFYSILATSFFYKTCDWQKIFSNLSRGKLYGDESKLVRSQIRK